MLRIAKLAASVGFGVVAVAVVAGIVAGGLGEQVHLVLGLSWGRIAVIDEYVALLTLWGWIAWRERDVVRSLLWLVAVVVLGSLAVTAYVLQAALRSDDVVDLLVGTRRRPVPELWRPRQPDSRLP